MFPGRKCYKARTETVCGLLSAVAEVTPSKLVAGTLGGAPCVISTKGCVVIPKNDGRFWILKLACVPVAATVPETRVKRRYIVSTLAVAGVLPAAAVKAVTCTDKACPEQKYGCVRSTEIVYRHG